MVSRGVFESFYVSSYSGLSCSLLLLLLLMFWMVYGVGVRLAEKIFAAGFPGRLPCCVPVFTTYFDIGNVVSSRTALSRSPFNSPRC